MVCLLQCQTCVTVSASLQLTKLRDYKPPDLQCACMCEYERFDAHIEIHLFSCTVHVQDVWF